MMGNIGPLEILIVIAMLGVFILPAIFFLLTLKNVLLACAPQNRALEPDKVWLALIPLFGAYWQYVVVLNIAKSLENEFASSGKQFDVASSKNVGLAMCILFSLSAIPMVSFFLGIPGIACWVVYWVKMANIKEMLRKSRSVDLVQGHKVPSEHNN